jgi:hypothetical protein
VSGSCPSDSFTPAGTVCRASIDPSSNCDPEEQCTGSSASCPMDTQRNGVQCRAAQGECDLPEFCNSGRCPSDRFKTTTENCGGSPAECENQAKCTGSNGQCAGPTPKGNSVQCGPQPPADPTCALRQVCSGAGGGCPAGFRTKNSGVVCNRANGDCDLDDLCDGSSQTCAPRFRDTNYVCNSKDDDCGDRQTCPGNAANCPARPFRPSSYVCRAAAGGGCDVDDRCDGRTYSCPDVKRPRGDVCRASISDCDVTETCDGTTNNCPADGFRPVNHICRLSKGLVRSSGDV